MSTITTKDGVEIFYKDWGSGQPIVFSHGWPLSADDWDTQMLFFAGEGFRVVAHDRRGLGRDSDDDTRRPLGPAFFVALRHASTRRLICRIILQILRVIWRSALQSTASRIATR
jgi:pimeloyl-ACP methyl ester carboxylesterase